MKRILPASCLFLLLTSTAALGQQTGTQPKSPGGQRALVKDAVFHSNSLQRDMHYRLLFPRDYSKGGRFAVLYLLHGLYGDYQNWDTRTHLENYARNLRFLIVMPDADDSWYTNSASVPTDKFEDYVIKDLIPEIDSKYRTIRERHARAIAGLSMGGYGAVKFGLKYPDRFAFVASLSGALNAAQDLDTLRPEFRDKLVEVFGSGANSTRAENDVFRFLETGNHQHDPYFYLACGSGDFFLETNRAFVRQLSPRRIAYEYHETAGDHSWDYWDKALAPLLQTVDNLVVVSAPTPK